jgi:hypothetical protein
LNKNYFFGTIAAVIAAILISVPVYLYGMYSAEAVYQRSLANTFSIQPENDTVTVVVRQGETKRIPVELHHWKGLEALLGVEFKEQEAEGGGLFNYPDGISVAFDLDGAYISLSKGNIEVMSSRDLELKSYEVKRVSPDGQIVVRDVGMLTVSASKDAPLGFYVFGLAIHDTDEHSGRGGEERLLEVQVIDSNADDTIDYTKLPEMSMFVYPADDGNGDDGMTKQFAGIMGTYCWRTVCADSPFIVPDNTIEIERGSTLEFHIINNKQPDELEVVIFTDVNEPADRELALLENGRYRVDLPEGEEYILLAGAYWKSGDYSADDAFYYYKVRVT